MIVYAVGSGTAFFMVWLGLGVMFILFIVALRVDLWHKLPNSLRKLVVVLLWIGGCCFVIVEGFVISGFNEKGKPDLDYIIILGSQVYENGPSVVLKYRLDQAIDYLEENPKTLCIVSGGQGYNEPFAEAVGMADYLKEKGIPEDRIMLEKESKTTEENISNSMAFIEDGASVGLVTNNFHVFRAMQIAKKQGLKNVCGIAAGATPMYLPNNMFREFFALIKFMI